MIDYFILAKQLFWKCLKYRTLVLVELEWAHLAWIVSSFRLNHCLSVNQWAVVSNVNKIIAMAWVSTHNGFGLEKWFLKLRYQQRLPELGEICFLVVKGITRAGIYINKTINKINAMFLGLSLAIEFNQKFIRIKLKG